jgi:hypothetical protein
VISGDWGEASGKTIAFKLVQRRFSHHYISNDTSVAEKMPGVFNGNQS